jgi:hypothetical protein
MTIIKHIVLVAVVCSSAASTLYGQSYTNSPGDSIIANVALEKLKVLNIMQVHPTKDTIYFKWKKWSVNMPSAWEASICDNGHCYPSLQDSGTMAPVVPGDNGLMSLHCTPHATFGTAIIRYTLFAINTPKKVDTLTWIINATATGIENIAIDGFFISIFLNKISIKNNTSHFSELSLYDLSGNRAFNTKITQDESEIILPPLLNSMYILNLTGNNKIFSQKIMLKQ